MDLTGKTVLVTGGTAGIGREMSGLLLGKGAIPVVTGRNPARIDGMRAEGFEVLSADLSNAPGVDDLLRQWGTRTIDVLVNNAGQLVDHDFRKGTPDADTADDCIYANLNAPIRLIGGLMDALKVRPEAAIVNVTSGLAISPAARQPVYCATKSGLRFYTLALRQQLKDTGIHVIEALAPVVDTQMNNGNPMRKMPAAECARQIVDALEKDRTEVNIGLTKALRATESVSPALARSITLRF